LQRFWERISKTLIFSFVINDDETYNHTTSKKGGGNCRLQCFRLMYLLHWFHLTNIHTNGASLHKKIITSSKELRPHSSWHPNHSITLSIVIFMVATKTTVFSKWLAPSWPYRGLSASLLTSEITVIVKTIKSSSLP